MGRPSSVVSHQHAAQHGQHRQVGGCNSAGARAVERQATEHLDRGGAAFVAVADFLADEPPQGVRGAR